MKIFRTLILGALVATLLSCGGNRSGSSDPRNNQLADGEGSVCNSPNIIGEYRSRISSGSCGIENPVAVYSVSGIRLSEPAVVNCDTARAFERWVNVSAKPAAARIGRELTEFRVAASYACRTRNHRPGARLSEHAYGNAIDISGFTFSDGETLTVQDAYGAYPAYFRLVREQACGIFGTVLGPGVRLHNDHFHFDIAQHGNGPYCR